MAEHYCDIHGPYDAAEPVCPACVAEGRIAPPDGLTEAPTSPFGPQDDDPYAFDERTKTNFSEDYTDALAFLIVMTPERFRGRVFKVIPGQVIGRKDAQVLINDARVSRQHARINLETDEGDGYRYFVLYDFGTSNGTFVNGERVEGRTMIFENDRVQMGDHHFMFKTLYRGG